MGRIIGYQYDDNVQDGDAWIGSEDGGGRTKQYTAEAVANYLNIQGKISIVGQMTYEYVVGPQGGIGTFSLFEGGTSPVAFSSVAKLTYSNIDKGGQRVVEFLNLLVGSDVLIAKQNEISTFGYYTVDSYTVNASDSSYYDLAVTFKAGNGAMTFLEIYDVQNFVLANDATQSPWNTVPDGISYTAANVGIGTETPVAKFQVVGGSAIIGDDDFNAVKISANGSATTYNAIGNGFISPNVNFNINNQTKLTIKGNTGNVGIGTTSPDSLLEIASDSVTDFLKLTSTGGGATPIKLIFEKSTSEQGVIEYNRNGDLEIYNTDADGGVMIDGSASEGADLYVANTGNVGIGTTNPGESLDVAGAIRGEAVFIKNTGGYNAKLLSGSLTTNKTFEFPDAGGTIALTSDIPAASQWDDVTGGINYASGNVGIGTTAPGKLLDVVGLNAEIVINDTNSSPKLRLRENGSTSAFIQTYLGNLDLVSGGDLNLYSNNTFRVTVKETTGNVGIGTTSPSEKLDVVGNIRVADEGEIYIQGSTSTRKIVRLDNTSDKGLITLNRNTETKVVISADFVNGGHTYFDGLNTNVGIGTTTPTSKLEVAGGDIELSDVAGGITMISPDGTRYRITVANGGTLTVTAV
tara:strand:+ start:137 stop:2038 length:1902 start_codon:yes stop_codon:yes gene_type:complete